MTNNEFINKMNNEGLTVSITKSGILVTDDESKVIGKVSMTEMYVHSVESCTSGPVGEKICRAIVELSSTKIEAR